MGVLKVILLAIEYGIKAVNFYHQTPEGKAEADALFAQLEAEGVDIPFWEPSPQEAARAAGMTGINAKGA